MSEEFAQVVRSADLLLILDPGSIYPKTRIHTGSGFAGQIRCLRLAFHRQQNR